jgi:hypothetical protein
MPQLQHWGMNGLLLNLTQDMRERRFMESVAFLLFLARLLFPNLQHLSFC